MGFPNGATTEQLYQKANELGLALCPAEVGPAYRLAYKNQPLNEWVYIGMKQIPNPDGDPGVFNVKRDGGGLWLYSYWAEPADLWAPGNVLMFRLPPAEGGQTSKDTGARKR